MPNAPSGAAIRDRFGVEQNYIRRYVDFLASAATVRYSEVMELTTVLTQLGLRPPPRRDWRHWQDPYSHYELTQLTESLAPAIPELELAIAEAEVALAALAEPADLSKVDVRSTIGEWIEFALDGLSDPDIPDQATHLRAELEMQMAHNRREMGEEAELLTASEQQYVIDSAVFLAAQRRLGELCFARDRIQHFDLAARIARPDSELSVLRQGFILLLTAFDATIFDLARVALGRDFLGLIGTFGDQGKVSFRQLAAHKSFDHFVAVEIENQLKPRYLKDLLFLFDGLGVDLADGSAGDRLVHVVELVMRRNVHVHNRGIVDERYVERDRDGTSQFNVYNLSLGDLVPIDRTYWERANTRCEFAVRKLAEWADTRGA